MHDEGHPVTLPPVLVPGDLWAQIVFRAQMLDEPALLALIDQAAAGSIVCGCYEAGRNPMCRIHGSTAGAIGV